MMEENDLKKTAQELSTNQLLCLGSEASMQFMDRKRVAKVRDEGHYPLDDVMKEE